MIQVAIKNSSTNEIPTYGSAQAAGMDLRADLSEEITIAPFERKIIPTGLSIALPEGYEAQVRPRSGLAAKHGITVLNAPGTVDADYRGDIGVILINLSNTNFSIEPGMRIAQLVIAQYATISWEQVEVLSDSERGIRGFGSTGAK
ncbi:MAG: dUTP diphosphatase [Flavobacteriales bacterium MED-G22]|nr:dUTP diphosphatase [Flavobacteriaceae bacterium]PDH44555.1 MAG: dUTP diphosphatase [Flavobacteriales bacterium MED-G22]|tara:strand:+ start:7607 stop:8044 length:438 start_codon:yes stop_codon:yes gene_type:complete